MIILHAFNPRTAAVRTRPTWQRLELLRRHGRQVVIDWPTDGAKSYGEAIAWCWGRGQDLCVLEQDLEPELAHLVALEECPRPVCMQAYQLHEGTVGSAAGVYAFRVFESGALRWGREGEEWADYFSLGCTRFRASAMVSMPPWSALNADGWAYLDHWLAAFCHSAGLRVHIHWPAIPHRHH